MEKTVNAAAPDWSDHPVDVLKWCAGQMGRELNPESEAQLRAICDEAVAIDPAFEACADWREVPMPEPTRIVEIGSLPAPVRVKGVIE